MGTQHQAPQLLAAPFRVKDGGCKWPGAMVSRQVRHGTAVDAKLGGAATLDERADAAAPRRQPAGVRFNFLEGGCVVCLWLWRAVAPPGVHVLTCCNEVRGEA